MEQKNKWSKEMIQDAAEIISLLALESERGCVLTISAYLEESLRDLLFAKCTSMSGASKKSMKPLFKDWESQFANFSSCIRLAFAMGLIDQWTDESMRRFASMRNDFSHHSGPKKIKASHVESITIRSARRDKSELFLLMTKIDMETTEKIVSEDIRKAMQLHGTARKQLTWWGTCLDVLLRVKAQMITTP